MKKIISPSKIQRLLKESLLYCQTGKLNEAKLIYQELLKVVPSHPDVLTNLGTIELQSGNIEAGINYIEKSIKINPIQPRAISNLGNAFLELKKNMEAINYYDLAIKMDERLPEAYYNKARALKTSQKYPEAISNYQQAIKYNPRYFEAFLNLGFIHNELKDFNKALEQYDFAISINPQSSEAFYNRGIVYENMGEHEKALNDYDIATKLNPNNFYAFNSKGLLFNKMKDFNSALLNFDCAIDANSKFFEGLFNKAILKLKLNDYKYGWVLYESRWDGVQKNFSLQTSKPKLESFSLAQKNVFIWAEQGIGDQIMYGTIFDEMIKSPNMFIISVDPRLIDLLERSFKGKNNLRFVSLRTNIDKSLYDFHLPLGSLGKFFRNSIDDFKSQPFSYLKPDSNKKTHLIKKIKNDKLFHCGISWISKNEKVGTEKGLNLNQLLPILQLPKVDFIDLQYGDTKVEKKSLFNDFDIEVRSIDEIDNFNDIDGLASLIDVCDFIVTISNVTAHIAGALGKKVFLMLPYSGAGKMWYWHESLNKSLWYPSIQIFTQTKAGDWSTPVNEIKEKIIREISYE
jgi:tetratricopeptide (TPR) repeat protein